MAKTNDTATSPAGTGEPKLKAFCEVVAAIGLLSRADQVDVLAAVAKFYNIAGSVELPR